LVALVVCTTAGAGDNESALELLRSMHKSARELNYQGTFIYSHGGKMESMQIYHRVDANGERERVVHLNGAPREVIRENDVVTCILPDSKSVLVSKLDNRQHILTSLPSNLETFRQYYGFSTLGHDRVAGRVATVVRVEPKDKFRYGYRFWLDAANALLLKAQMLGDDGAAIEQLMFTSLEVVPDLPEALLKPALKGEHLTLVEQKPDDEPMQRIVPNWHVMQLPDGFRPTGHNRRHLVSGAAPAHHIVLSDGLASMSVYIEKLDPAKKKFIGASYMGAVNVYGAVVDDHQITVVGEVPAATVKMVAESIQYAK
jgi:sigma-E factor negative regulatory protein RseB